MIVPAFRAVRRRMYDLKLWPNVEADGSDENRTPGKITGADERLRESARLNKVLKHFEEGHVTRSDWLDRLTMTQVLNIKEQEKRDSEAMYLMIEFPQIVDEDIEYLVVYYEAVGTCATFQTSCKLINIGLCFNHQGGDETDRTKYLADIVTVPDPEMGLV